MSDTTETATRDEPRTWPPELLGLTEFARLSNISDKTARGMLRSGMPHIRIGRAIYVRKERVLEWMRAREAERYAPHKWEHRSREALEEVGEDDGDDQ